MMGYYIDNDVKEVKNDIDFMGKGIIDGENVEITFKTNSIEVRRDENYIPRMIIYPSFNKEKETFFEMKTINSKNNDKVKGKYTNEYINLNIEKLKNELEIFEDYFPKKIKGLKDQINTLQQLKKVQEESEKLKEELKRYLI